VKADLRVNGEPRAIEADGDTPLLWVLRDHLRMTGTKFGCGIGQCGACTVHMNGVATRSCSVPLASAVGTSITTIEGLSADNSHPVQKAWIAEQVPQCGYCQSGQILAAAALLNKHPHPTDEDIDMAMQGNLCRCGCYTRIRKAIKTAAASTKPASTLN